MPLLNRKYTVKIKPKYNKSECGDVASIIELVNEGLFIPDFLEYFVQILGVSGELFGSTQSRVLAVNYYFPVEVDHTQDVYDLFQVVSFVLFK